jgi:hypothetical protein
VSQERREWLRQKEAPIPAPLYEPPIQQPCENSRLEDKKIPPSESDNNTDELTEIVVWPRMVGIADFRLSIADIRNSKLEIRNSQKTPLRLSGAEFRFSASTIGDQQSAIKDLGFGCGELQTRRGEIA